ncbi:hypothetical protein JCM15519_30340 [Fundidesulfovibrio butyratiphilus]
MTANSGNRVLEGVLVVNAPDDCEDQAFAAMRRRVLADVHTQAARALVIDMSRVEMLDSTLFSILSETARMAGLLGARTVFAGFQPGVVSALIDLDVACSDIESALNLEDAFELLRALPTESDPPEDSPQAPGDAEAETPPEGTPPPLPSAMDPGRGRD